MKEDASIPKGFLDNEDICLLPTFYQPETQELKWATHNNVRKTLFYSMWRNLKYCAFKRLKSENDSFELDSVTEGVEGLFDLFIEKYWSKEKIRGKLI